MYNSTVLRIFQYVNIALKPGQQGFPITKKNIVILCSICSDL